MGNHCCEESIKPEGLYRTEQIYNNRGGKTNKSLIEQHRPSQSANHQKAYINSNILRRKEEVAQSPVILPKVQQTLEKQKFFQRQLSFITPHHRKYHNDIYVGQLDEVKNIPHGLGTMYQEDGSVYVGLFDNGVGHGKGAYVARDGSFYYGRFNKNIAQTQQGTQGYFESDQLKYTGNFKDNKFHGFGVQNGKNYRFQGFYANGARTDGAFIWKGSNGDYQYKGNFNSQNKFHGKGILKDSNGVYQGFFHNGRKHGEGQYRTNDGKRYVGKFQYDELQGPAIIYNADNSVYYMGQFMNSLPLRRSIIQ